jgi:hypothetical protein
MVLVVAALAVSCAGRGASRGAGEVEILMGTLSSAGTLVTEKGEVYVISPEGEGAELLKNVERQAIVTGPIHKEGARKVISVSSYQIVEKTSGGTQKGED